MDNFFRPAPELEKDGYIILGENNRTQTDAFYAKLATKQQEYQKAFKPFDGYAAKLDFQEAVRKFVDEISTTVDKSKINRTINTTDLDRYGNADRFTFKESEEITEDKLLDGIRMPTVVGKNYTFVAKQRGNGITIFVPSKEVASVDEYINKTYLNKSEAKPSK